MFVKSFKSALPMVAGDNASVASLNEFNEFPIDFVPAEGSQAHTIGLVRFEDDGKYVKEFSDLELLQVGQSVKKVDKKKVKRLLNERLEEIRVDMESQGQEFFVAKEDMKVLKADIEFGLLPETEPEDFFNYVVLDKTTNLFYVINGSKKVAEAITCFFRNVLGTFPSVGFSVHEEAIVKGFGTLLKEHEADRLTLGNYIKLEDSEGVVVWTKESLYDSKAIELKEDGKDVVAIGLEYDGVLEFVVDKELKLSKLRFPKYFNDDEGSIEASTLLCFNEIRGLMADLTKATILK
ncbi:hypothetical protein [Escherichia phage phiWec190]|uniref:recombination-associated protein RdgC n=1 Tax=Escherichia coli TaxID=562 RepID=UPI001FF1043B|nr:recombination-associated protein RdgC [Escherichia coli]MCJ8478735.1 recombination-associated protein RdgC [Escherichia coli]BDU13220.1 hypothetical protein [Escherichia phage phiWec188]BDU13683.1 hypothetical protein [Escherichia phage phiWec190]